MTRKLQCRCGSPFRPACVSPKGQDLRDAKKGAPVVYPFVLLPKPSKIGAVTNVRLDLRKLELSIAGCNFGREISNLRAKLTALALVSTCTAASAQAWFTTTEEDVFTGNQTATMISVATRSQGAFFQCDADRELSFALIFKSEEKPSGVPGIIVAKVDRGEVHRFDATSYRHNEDYLGFVSNDTAEVAKLVADIAKARRDVLLGLQIPITDAKFSVTASAAGSTKAANKLLETCGIE